MANDRAGAGEHNREPMALRSAGWALVAAGVALGAVWASGRVEHPFAPVAALLLVGAGGMLLPRVHGVAERMRPLVGKQVTAEAWGAELPGHAGVTFRVDLVRAVGAGLHLYLAPLPEGKPLHLKVAQPREATIDERGAEIAGAKYVQWAGRKVEKFAGAKALVVKSSL
jgi:hypothetical protein